MKCMFAHVKFIDVGTLFMIKNGMCWVEHIGEALKVLG